MRSPAIATSSTEKTEFLVGAEPRWSDVQSGRAIEREVDRQIAEAADELISTRGPKGSF